MKKLCLFVYFFGIVLFAASFFYRTTATEMYSSEGKEVKNWRSGSFEHFVLALKPINEIILVADMLRVPYLYGSEEKGDGYDFLLQKTAKESLSALPAFIGWWTVWLSLALSVWLFKGTLQNSFLRFLLFGGSLLMLLAVPLLAFDFYNRAITYKPYFHLGSGAYLIIGAYLFIGVGVLLLLKQRQVEGKL